MITAYILILCFSAWLVANLLLRVTTRLVKVIGFTASPSAGGIALLSALLFLIVVGAPAAMLVGAILLAVVSLLDARYTLPLALSWGAPLLAATLTVGLGAALPAIAQFPPIAAPIFAGIALLCIVVAADWFPNDVTTGSIGFMASLLPLLAAPLLGAPSFIALDAALLGSALLGVGMTASRSSLLGIARAPMALILGWLMVQAAAHGAWIASLVSALVYGGTIAYSLSKTPHRDVYAS